MLQIWLALIGGLFLGWLIEWLIDWQFWRRNNETLRQDNQALRQQLEATKSELTQLKAVAVGDPIVPPAGEPERPSTEGN